MQTPKEKDLSSGEEEKGDGAKGVFGPPEQSLGRLGSTPVPTTHSFLGHHVVGTMRTGTAAE